MLALEEKKNVLIGHCASSLIDRYQQHGGGACVEGERETALCYCQDLQNTVCGLHSTGAALTFSKLSKSTTVVLNI